MNPAAKFAQPTLADLTARFVSRPVSEVGDAAVTPHEMPASFATDPRTAWSEATAVLAGLGDGAKPGPMPTDWAACVRQSTDADFLPMALGNFPQQVRDVSILLQKKPIPATAEPLGWTAKDTILAAAAARVARRFDEADRLLNEAEGVSESLLANERAALAWSRGDRKQAEAIWAALPASGPVHFNRGVAALAAGRSTDAAASFAEAAKLLPETSGWHHLANLYRALAR
ncbi:MAG: hypothetical protein KF873_04710 [Gemmataceae bacterium]|nr:hypothetical protein [Planctomycetia bacterium]MBX3398019.1 hypothetical protein [Gemmataceae bacterium]